MEIMSEGLIASEIKMYLNGSRREGVFKLFSQSHLLYLFAMRFSVIRWLSIYNYDVATLTRALVLLALLWLLGKIHIHSEWIVSVVVVTQW